MNTAGAAGEAFAVSFLEAHHCRIAARNFHSRYGEIDVIAENELHLIFLEVKTRTVGAMVSPLAAVTPAKQRRILRTAQAYLMQFPTDLQPRFDVMGIWMEKGTGKICTYTYLKSAFPASSF